MKKISAETIEGTGTNNHAGELCRNPSTLRSSEAGDTNVSHIPCVSCTGDDVEPFAVLFKRLRRH